MHEHFDIAVVGGGLAGSVAALAAAAEGWRVAFIAPQPPRQDGRTTALLSESVDFLARLGVWDAVEPSSAPLRTMRILDGTTRLLRAPPVSFRSSEIGLDAFGYNIPNKPLFEELQAATTGSALITRFESSLVSAVQSGEAVELNLEDGTRITALAALAADGRGSKLREDIGIRVRTWTYPQTALVLNFTHSIAHSDTSTEFHTEQGPFTQVPLPGKRSSLVWAVKPDQVDIILAMPRDQLNLEVETRMSSILGKVEVEGEVQAWPLSSLIAHSFGTGRTMLVGETGHAFPPIGAQGLNLGLRDIMQAIQALKTAGGPEQAPRAVSAYNRQRWLDVTSRTAGVDLLNRTLLSSFLPVQALRAGGLAVLSAIPPLRNLAMREGMTPGWRKARSAA
ncbi:MAG: UbiH/UbiF family hydroxylase [Hoeflea sp.]|uniref:UbiH/UbiF family hydroxylase n=1 Tax=Hoeflea sp. TaxID=1940281 RepID=UPI001D69FB1A|nr:UbiH/UbiF family hydroxylase [Hoeflea sp.]MBU4529542.1 UbiH/UbiF family hydroxylase [Alphaproteobacteria bacterium]MBU4546661.1 UbiH/UbiF family hydroxylase [Alphaproteobacteria bacterium]MBU4550929.1 UbiH/UbiF family hydroxylase [Alphaproteobacteria bacterium]MBV1723871.1 UbiH/UbiF family hydroxylase [Hoeflea sp.]MBV1763148.1 UbiH/UbiF family hydroxylase [Hoeflea sp.]